MARTRHTLKGDPKNPPKNIQCGYCGTGHRPGVKTMLETMKACCICNKPFPVHTKCAKSFYKHQNKKKEIFNDKKFLNAKFKFFCNNCKTPVCVTCDKEHPLGTPQTYIAEKGKFMSNDDSQFLRLFNGHIQIYNSSEDRISEIAFEIYDLNLLPYGKKESSHIYSDE